MWQGWISGILGLWLLVSAFTVAGNKTGDLTNDLILGIVFLILGIWAGIIHKSWQSWVVAVIGTWMVIAGLWFPASYGGNLANDLIMGAVVAIAGFWSTKSSVVIPREKSA